ncbi:MAG: SGNH/GDSL hydrolase family protein [Butyrivibrio sp.]|nr:SGNH/GDSL hydrolase family protein [Butyrivibrio sp.]MBR1641478.1 SGNH/GDSL hydrolase family protein [Butyrivibrio sp.]
MKLKRIFGLLTALILAAFWASGCGKTSLQHMEVVEDGVSAYQKLADGQPVNLLIVGDSIAEGTGAKGIENSWAELVAGDLGEKYGSVINMTNVSMGGCTSLCGYVRVQNINDGLDNDLAVICYGENDEEEDFALYYESIIRALRLKYPSIEIVCIQESSQRDYTFKMKVISEIAEHYKLPVADTIEPFKADYDNLTVDGCHPNNAGHRIYADVVESIVDDAVQNRVLSDYDIEPYDGDVLFFDNYTWISRNDFLKLGKRYCIKIPKTISGNGKKTSLSDGSGVYLVTDIVDQEGSNNIKIYSDKEEIASREFEWNYSFEQRHIPILQKDVILQEGITLSIQFESGKQAKRFEGIGFIG